MGKPAAAVESERGLGAAGPSAPPPPPPPPAYSAYPHVEDDDANAEPPTEAAPLLGRPRQPAATGPTPVVVHVHHHHRDRDIEAIVIRDQRACCRPVDWLAGALCCAVCGCGKLAALCCLAACLGIAVLGLVAGLIVDEHPGSRAIAVGGRDGLPTLYDPAPGEVLALTTAVDDGGVRWCAESDGDRKLVGMDLAHWVPANVSDFSVHVRGMAVGKVVVKLVDASTELSSSQRVDEQGRAVDENAQVIAHVRATHQWLLDRTKLQLNTDRRNRQGQFALVLSTPRFHSLPRNIKEDKPCIQVDATATTASRDLRAARFSADGLSLFLHEARGAATPGQPPSQGLQSLHFATALGHADVRPAFAGVAGQWHAREAVTAGAAAGDARIMSGAVAPRYARASAVAGNAEVALEATPPVDSARGEGDKDPSVRATAECASGAALLTVIGAPMGAKLAARAANGRSRVRVVAPAPGVALVDAMAWTANGTPRVVAADKAWGGPREWTRPVGSWKAVKARVERAEGGGEVEGKVWAEAESANGDAEVVVAESL